MIAGRVLFRASPPAQTLAASGLSGLVSASGREWSAIRKVARATSTTWRQPGHFGVMVLPVTPWRYESRMRQCGQGPNHAVAIDSP
jgi:hypothetical protein